MVAVRAGSGFRVRSFRNRFPLVSGASSPPPPSAHSVPAGGHHEVIVESDLHDVDLVDLEPAAMAAVFLMYRDRAAFIASREGVAAVNLFRNRGKRAGSSQPHPHAQVLGSVVPGPAQQLRAAQTESLGRALLTNALEQAGPRLLRERDQLVALTPYAPTHNYETWITLRDPKTTFADESDETVTRFAIFAQEILRAVVAASRRDYNLVFRLPVQTLARDPRAFWYLEVAPRGGSGAGFELSSGMSVVTTMPEVAAEEIRAALTSPT